MKTGTKSLLFGGHQFILHPVFVTVAWKKLKGQWPTRNELLAIIIHDWGYWGKEKMDDYNGEEHPRDTIMYTDRIAFRFHDHIKIPGKFLSKKTRMRILCKYNGFRNKYFKFIVYHSRFMARKCSHEVSELCLPDKYGVALMPTWLWVLLCTLSGEIKEYMNETKYEINNAGPSGFYYKSKWKFFRAYKEIVDKWISGEVPLEPWREQK